MRIDILTLFPGNMDAMLHESILGRAAKKGIIEINCVQIRDFTQNRQRQVDDYPYGGGWGCVMMAQPLKSCLDSVMADAGKCRSRVICMSPQGSVFTQDKARQLLRDYDRLVLVCGHYEGIDQRFIDECVDEELSIGDFVLTGGELAAMAVADCVCRMVPGVLSDEECFTGESHWEGLLEYPQYTRPEVWEGRPVPEVLKNGNHAEISRWRRKQMLLRTMDRRPDLYARFALSGTDAELAAEIEKDRSRPVLTLPVECRKAGEDDLEGILLIVRQARNFLRRHGVDQWQCVYPDETVFRADIARGEAYVLTYGGAIAAVFTLASLPDPNYAAITDGKWRCEGPYCTLHRCAVGAEFHSSGLSRRMMAEAEAIARSRGALALRCDTHRKNKAMRRLLENSGFVYRGNVLTGSDPDRDRRRQAFEKILACAGPGGAEDPAGG